MYWMRPFIPVSWMYFIQSKRNISYSAIIYMPIISVSNSWRIFWLKSLIPNSSFRAPTMKSLKSLSTETLVGLIPEPSNLPPSDFNSIGRPSFVIKSHLLLFFLGESFASSRRAAKHNSPLPIVFPPPKETGIL